MMITVVLRDGFSILPSHELWILILAHHCFQLSNYSVIIFLNKLPEIPEYAKMQLHMMTLLDVLGKIAWVG